MTKELCDEGIYSSFNGIKIVQAKVFNDGLAFLLKSADDLNYFEDILRTGRYKSEMLLLIDASSSSMNTIITLENRMKSVRLARSFFFYTLGSSESSSNTIVRYQTFRKRDRPFHNWGNLLKMTRQY